MPGPNTFCMAPLQLLLLTPEQCGQLLDALALSNMAAWALQKNQVRAGTLWSAIACLGTTGATVQLDGRSACSRLGPAAAQLLGQGGC